MPHRIRPILILLLLPFALAHTQQYGWQVMARLNTFGLYTVDFVDTLHGWCAGQDTIYRTTDGGATWHGSSRPFGANSWNSLSFSDTLYGWAVGRLASNDGLIWRTTDGGVNWTEQQFVFERVYAGTFSQSRERNTTSGSVWSSLDTGLVVRTTTGGSTWQEQRFDSIRGLRKVTFVDSFHGWIDTGPNFILRTADGGASWSIHSTPANHFEGLAFIDSLRGWGGEVNTIYRTTDGGSSWQLQYVISPSPPEDFEIFDLSFSDSMNGWAFGGGFYNGGLVGMIYRTTNGGSSWFRESIGMVAYGYGDGIMLDRFHGWAVAADGRVVAYRPTTDLVEKLPGLPKAFALRQNYPNPFNPITIIEYELARRGTVKLAIHDILGRSIETLVDQLQEPGLYRVQFNGAALATGTYLYTLETSHYKETKQLLLTK
jgi:photosystem II stability/assembly factor-like uncharacterized protein